MDYVKMTESLENNTMWNTFRVWYRGFDVDMNMCNHEILAIAEKHMQKRGSLGCVNAIQTSK
jgi:hypothetical protein